MGKADIEKMISDELSPRREGHEVTGSRPLVALRLGDPVAMAAGRPAPPSKAEGAVPAPTASRGRDAASLSSVAKKAIARLKR